METERKLAAAGRGEATGVMRATGFFPGVEGALWNEMARWPDSSVNMSAELDAVICSEEFTVWLRCRGSRMDAKAEPGQTYF